jgi:hypothetical protein
MRRARLRPLPGRGKTINAFLILAGTILGFILVEVALRALDFSSPGFCRSDIYAGAALREGAEGWWTREGRALVRISSQGLRDREHPTIKPSGTYRIAILGDSYAEAMQVPIDDTFWKVLEAELSACRRFTGRQVEAINFGVAGYGTAQELLTLRHRVWDYSPDLVLLAFLTGNDVRNNLRALEQDPMRPYFLLKGGRLVLDDSFREYFGWRFRESVMRNGGDWLIDHSRILQLLNNVRYHFKARLTQGSQNSLVAGMARNRAAMSPGEGEVGLDQMVYREPADPLWRDAWRVTEELILQMNDEVSEKSSAFLLVTLTNGDQVYPDPLWRSTVAKRLGVPDLLYPERRIKSLGERRGIPVLNLAQPFAAYAERHRIHLQGIGNGGGHWNQEGHRLAGRLIAEKMCSDSHIQFNRTLP